MMRKKTQGEETEISAQKKNGINVCINDKRKSVFSLSLILNVILAGCVLILSEKNTLPSTFELANSSVTLRTPNAEVKTAEKNCNYYGNTTTTNKVIVLTEDRKQQEQFDNTRICSVWKNHWTPPLCKNGRDRNQRRTGSALRTSVWSQGVGAAGRKILIPQDREKNVVSEFVSSPHNFAMSSFFAFHSFIHAQFLDILDIATIRRNSINGSKNSKRRRGRPI